MTICDAAVQTQDQLQASVMSFSAHGDVTLGDGVALPVRRVRLAQSHLAHCYLGATLHIATLTLWHIGRQGSTVLIRTLLLPLPPSTSSEWGKCCQHGIVVIPIVGRCAPQSPTDVTAHCAFKHLCLNAADIYVTQTHHAISHHDDHTPQNDRAPKDRIVPTTPRI
jgi:hypothetical protein